jgi:predicted nuclease with TOPRIM domain
MSQKKVSKKDVAAKLELAKLCKQLVKKRRSIQELKEEHDALFEKLADKEADAQNLEDQIKAISRELAADTGNTKLVDSADITLEVKPTYNAQTFSVKKATKYWPEEVVSQARRTIIDVKIVEELVAAGILDQKKLDAAADGPRVLRSKNVFIKINGLDK